MAVMTFDNINVQDLNEGLLESIRAFFKSGNLRISIINKTEAPLAEPNLGVYFKKHPEEPYIVRFDPDFDFNALAEKIESDDSFDVMEIFENRKISNPYHASAS